MIRSVLAFAGTRADFWPLEPVLAATVEAGIATQLAAVADVLADADSSLHSNVQRIEIAISSQGGERVALARRAMLLGESTAAILDREQPDLFLVLGDRYELLPVVTAANVLGVPVAHLSGGEITEGALDDAVRHAVTKLSHIHFCGTEMNASLIRSLGEDPSRIHVVGQPGLDRLRQRAASVDLDALERLLGKPIVRPVALVTYHPPTLDLGSVDSEMDAIVSASDAFGSVIATHPGPDPGSGHVLARLRDWAAQSAKVSLVPSLGALYPKALDVADVVIGNSSSGLIEAPTLGTPVVNVGIRQKGRERWAGVIDANGDVASVRKAVTTALDSHFVSQIRDEPNPYGDGHAGVRIARILAAQDAEVLRRKWFVPS